MNPNDLRKFTNRRRAQSRDSGPSIPQEFLDALGKYGPDPKGIDLILSHLASPQPETMMVIEMLHHGIKDLWEAGLEFEKDEKETLFGAAVHERFDACCERYPMLCAFIVQQFLSGIGGTQSLPEQLHQVISGNIDHKLLDTMAEEFLRAKGDPQAGDYLRALKRMDSEHAARTKLIMTLMDARVVTVSSHIVLTILGMCDYYSLIEGDAVASVRNANRLLDQTAYEKEQGTEEATDDE